MHLYAALAAALDRLSEELIFLTDTDPIHWREALLHQIVQQQRIDPQGGGFWQDDGSTLDATRHALDALRITLGIQPPTP